MKILIIGAMDKEVSPLVEELGAQNGETLLGNYPLYLSKLSENLDIYILKTQVGDTNASVASFAAIEHVNPDFVFKIGCVGGNSADLHKGDIIIPSGFFHSSAWITRSYKDNTPTSDASLWQSVFGDLPYQVNQENLGNQPYFFKPDLGLTNKYQSFLQNKNIKSTTAYIGGGNMWFFEKNFMEHIAQTCIPKDTDHKRWGADMESYAIAHSCFMKNKPFTGFYLISNSDYYEEPYVPEELKDMFNEVLVSFIPDFLKSLK